VAAALLFAAFAKLIEKSDVVTIKLKPTKNFLNI
jgi:hypothetical protein